MATVRPERRGRPGNPRSTTSRRCAAARRTAPSTRGERPRAQRRATSGCRRAIRRMSGSRVRTDVRGRNRCTRTTAATAGTSAGRTPIRTAAFVRNAISSCGSRRCGGGRRRQNGATREKSPRRSESSRAPASSHLRSRHPSAPSCWRAASPGRQPLPPRDRCGRRWRPRESAAPELAPVA